jgi:hypothetical protein
VGWRSSLTSENAEMERRRMTRIASLFTKAPCGEKFVN